MNSISKDNSTIADDRWVTPGRFYRCEGEEVSRARIRSAALRSQLGVIGFGASESLDEVLATLIREGDAFDKWRGSREGLRNLQVVRRTRGIVTLLTPFDSPTRILDLPTTPDSQLEIWECGDDRELRFPVFRLPLSAIENGRAMKIKERIRSDVVLSFDIKNDRHRTSFAIGLNTSVATRPVINGNAGDGFTPVLSDGIAMLSRVREFLKPAFHAITGFRTTPAYPWQYQDVRNDSLYRLGDLWRPAMSLQ